MIIYMNETIKYISTIDPTFAQEVIKSGVVKHTKDEIPYLIIN